MRSQPGVGARRVTGLGGQLGTIIPAVPPPLEPERGVSCAPVGLFQVQVSSDPSSIRRGPSNGRCASPGRSETSGPASG